MIIKAWKLKINISFEIEYNKVKILYNIKPNNYSTKFLYSPKDITKKQINLSFMGF